MRIKGELKQMFRELRYDMRQLWGNATAKPISFEHLPATDRPGVEAVFDNFLSDAARGYFDPEHEKSFGQFLRGQGFDKFQINRAVQEFRVIADEAAASERERHAITQGRYWNALKEQRNRETSAIVPTHIPAVPAHAASPYTHDHE